MTCLFDLETTGIDVTRAEIITGYFSIIESNEIVDDYHMFSKPDVWSEEAAKIHGIDKSEADTFPNKAEAFRSLLTWIKKHSPKQFMVYANPDNFGEYFHYDIAVIKWQLYYLSESPHFFYKYFNDNVISVYTMAKEAHKNGLYHIPRSSKNRVNYSMENVYHALFSKRYKAHDAKHDVNATLKIYNKLNALKNRDSIFTH